MGTVEFDHAPYFVYDLESTRCEAITCTDTAVGRTAYLVLKEFE